MVQAGTKAHADAYTAGLHGQPMPAAAQAQTPGDGSVGAAYDQGLKDGGHRPAHSRPRVTNGTGQRTASTAGSSRSSGNSQPQPKPKPQPKRTAAQRVSSGVRRAASQTYSASGGPGLATQLWHIVWMGMGLVVLYLVLQSAPTDNRVVKWLLGAVHWVMSPTATL